MWLLATGIAVKSPVAVKITSGAERFGADGIDSGGIKHKSAWESNTYIVKQKVTQ